MSCLMYTILYDTITDIKFSFILHPTIKQKNAQGNSSPRPVKNRTHKSLILKGKKNMNKLSSCLTFLLGAFS